MAEPVKAKLDESPLPIDNAVAQLRQPLATIEIPSAMDVSGIGKRSSFSTNASACDPFPRLKTKP